MQDQSIAAGGRGAECGIAPLPVMPPRPKRRLATPALLKAAATNSLTAFDEELFDELIVERRYVGQRICFVSHPEGIKRVFLDNFSNYPRVPRIRRLFEAGLGTGSLASEGETWWRHRRIGGPTIDPRAVLADAPAMIELVTAWAASLDAHAGGPAIDVEGTVFDLLIRLWNQVVTGGNRDAVAMLESWSKFPRKPRLGDFIGFPAWLDPRPSLKRRQHEVAQYDELLYALIDERKAADYGGPHDLIWRLTHAEDRRSDDRFAREEVRDEAASMIAGGVSPTVRALTWVWYLLSLHPWAEERLHRELDSVLRAGRLSAADLDKLAFTRAIVEETMRLYPPIPGILRVADAEDLVCGHRVRRGSIIAILPWVVHRHRRLWTDPDRFNPERFAPEQSRSRPRFAYIPFAGGPRICVGAAFAMTQMLIVVALLARRFRLRLAPGRAVRPVGRISLHPEGGLYVILEPRAAAPG